MQRFVTSLCAAAIAACVAVPVTAQEKKPPPEQQKKRTPEQVFGRLDANGDKKLSLAEFQGKREAEQAKKLFDAKDADKDGSLTFDEYKTQPAAAKTAPDKPQRTPEETFARLDSNGDKQVTFDEFKRKRDETKARELFDRRDANKDGHLTLEEFKGPAKKKDA
jgi:Ca2+-binding EF-hand superfamily protein